MCLDYVALGADGVRRDAVAVEDAGVLVHGGQLLRRAGEDAIVAGAREDVVRLVGRVPRVAEDQSGSD